MDLHDDPSGAVAGLQGIPYADNGLHHEQFAYMPEDGHSELNGVQSGESQPDDQGIPRNQQDGRQGRQRGPRRNQSRNTGDYSLALRILVPSGMVGAIIGKEGSKIDKITSETATQIDFHKKEEKGPPEKMVTIRGSPAACTEANQKIHELMREEMRKSSERLGPLIQMRLLIHDNLAGSVIGKKGDHLRQVKEETHTNISVSKKDETLYWPDRVITIQCRVKEGPDFEEDQQVSEAECLKHCAKAEGMLSEKARKSYRINMEEVQRQEHMMMCSPTSGPMQIYPGNAYAMNASPPYGGPFVNWLQGYLTNPYTQGQTPYMQQMQPVKTYLAIPSKFAGVVIGSKGGYCQFMKKITGAHRIVVTQDDGSGERLVEIVGTPPQQYFAQHCVYCIVSEHSRCTAELRAEIKIPLKGFKGETNVIGRLIGKNGQNIKVIQKDTATYIEVLPKGQIGPEVKEATVHIVGTFTSSQYAQMRVREIISEALAQQPVGGRPGQVAS